MEPIAPQIEKKETSVGGSILFSIVQQAIVLMLGLGMLDGGQFFQIVSYAAVAYWGGFTIIMAQRSRTLTRPDKILIRWGYLVLCFIVSPSVTGLVWGLRGY